MKKRLWQTTIVLAIIVILSLIFYARENTTNEIFQINKEKAAGMEKAGKISLSPPEPGLVAYYKFENNANDEDGKNNGSVFGALFVSGMIGNALSFDGVNDYVKLPDINETDKATKLTLVYWIKPFSVNSRRVTITKWPSAFWTELTNKEISAAAISGQLWTTTNANLSKDKWYLVTHVYDGTQTGNDNRYKVYVNSVRKTVSFGGNVPSQLNDTGNKNINIGTYNNGDGYWFNGIIDEVRIYNRTLAENEIAGLYIQCIPKCSDRQCGDNECSGSCGACSSGQDCIDYKCARITVFATPVRIFNPQAQGCECVYLDYRGMFGSWLSYNLSQYNVPGNASFVILRAGCSENIMTIRQSSYQITGCSAGNNAGDNREIPFYLNNSPIIQVLNSPTDVHNCHSYCPSNFGDCSVCLSLYTKGYGFFAQPEPPPPPPQPTCPGNQTILKLSDETNAHGELWNGTNNYSVSICYNNIFGTNYTGINPHDCTGTNKIVGLFAETNSHAEIPSLTNYTINVCYGDLSCISRASCNADERAVVSLSSDTNAHLANDSSYPVKICCKFVLPSLSNITSAYWANMNNNQINQTDLNDRVKMIASGIGFQGREINFTIYKNVWWWRDKKVALSSSFEFVIWRAGEKADGSFESGNYYFEAVLAEGGQVVTSGMLNVRIGRNNSAPVAIILSPRIGEVYWKNENVSFTQASYDEDDFFNYTWNFGDNQQAKGSTRTYDNYNTEHAYISDGQKNIILDAIDERGLAGRNRSSILIIDPASNTKYVFAHIAKPLWGENFYDKIVRFNASTSYSIQNVSGRINCVAGSCPNSMASNGTLIFGTPNWTGFSNLEFNWTFSYGTNRTGYGFAGSEFTKLFLTSGQQWARVKVSINPGSETETNFSVTYLYPFCFVQENAPINQQTFWIEGINYNPSFNDCYRADGARADGTNGSEPYCCPAGYSCANQAGAWRCVLTGIEYCNDYRAESECNTYTPAVAKRDVEFKTRAGYCSRDSRSCDAVAGTSCWDCVTSCRCFWNSTASQCQSSYNLTRACDTTPPTITPRGGCLFGDLESSNCSGGYRFLNWSASWTGNLSVANYCKPGSVSVPCLSANLLGFFSFQNVILVIILLIIIYFFIMRKKEKREIRVKRRKKRATK